MAELYQHYSRLFMSDSIMEDRRNVAHWYALYVRSRFEKKVNAILREKGLESYLPLRTVLKQWSDRKKKVLEPLFSCYVFVRISLRERIYAVESHGVVRMVSFNGHPSPIPDDEIHAVKTVLEGADTFETTQYFGVGQMVEVITGPLEGIRGRLIQHRGQKRLLVGIAQIKQAITVEVNEWEVKSVWDQGVEATKAYS